MELGSQAKERQANSKVKPAEGVKLKLDKPNGGQHGIGESSQGKTSQLQSKTDLGSKTEAGQANRGVNGIGSQAKAGQAI